MLAALAGKEIDDHETQLQKQLVIESIEAYVISRRLLWFLLC